MVNKFWGASSEGGAKSASLVGIGLTDLPKLGEGAVAPLPPNSGITDVRMTLPVMEL